MRRGRTFDLEKRNRASPLVMLVVLKKILCYVSCYVNIVILFVPAYVVKCPYNINNYQGFNSLKTYEVKFAN